MIRTAKSGDVEKELHATLDEVTAQHLIADVPVGLLLSGGLDSSLIAALAARQTKVRTFTMGFAHSDLDERAQARRVARHIGSEHEEIVIAPQEVTDDLESTIACFDDLFADWGTISTRLLYGKCRERGIKVVLVGEGADELFGGYDVFRSSASRAPADWWLFQLYRSYCGRRYGRYFGAFRALMRDYLNSVDGDRFDAIRLFETRNQLPNNYVMKVDKASMSVSVEARVPYLDQRVAEIAYRIPKSLLLAEGTEKNVLRRVARRFQLLAGGDAGSPEAWRQHGRILAGRAAGVPQFCQRYHPRQGRMDRSPGLAAGDGGLLREQPRGLCLPARRQHLPQSRLAPTDPRDVVERIPGRPRCWLKGWSAPSFLSTTGPRCCARRLRACLPRPTGRSRSSLSTMDQPTKRDAKRRRWQKAHSEVRAIHRENGGPGAARETGRLAARGEFIQYLDSDDLLLPTKFELQVAGLRQCGDCAVSYGKTRFYAYRRPPH